MKNPLTLLFLLLAAAVPAQDGLYAPSVPEDAALVRVINATGDPITVDIGPLRYADVPPRGASAYRPLQPDVYLVMHAGEREVLTPERRSFFTVVLLPDRIAVVPDERHTDPARAQLVLYNFTSAPVELRAVDPDVAIVPPVEPGRTGGRVVNAITVEIASVHDTAPVFTESLAMERGGSYTVVVAEGVDRPFGFVVTAAVSGE